jgi:hypothetical protein
MLAAKVDAAAVAQLAGRGQLAAARILIVSPSNTDRKLPVPGGSGWPKQVQAAGIPSRVPGSSMPDTVMQMLPHLLWLDLGCGVADLKPWLQHAKRLVVLRATEVRLCCCADLPFTRTRRWMQIKKHVLLSSCRFASQTTGAA